MQKAEPQSAQAHNQVSAKQGSGVAVESPQTEQIIQLEALIESSPQTESLGKIAAMMDTGSAMAAQRKTRDLAANSPRQQAVQQLADGINHSPLMAAQRRKIESPFVTTQRVKDEEPLQQVAADLAPAQLASLAEAKPNKTGLPDQLKSGIENLSGMSMDNVKVHYNSSQPAQLNALAYAQGTDIHVAPGQEQHLPHEAWHVVQQAQGKVRPTMQMKDGVPVNDDLGLERADVMGRQAGSVQLHSANTQGEAVPICGLHHEAVQLKKLDQKKLNVVGENHSESEKWRDREKQIAKSDAGGGYWTESEFRRGGKGMTLAEFAGLSDGEHGDDPLLLVEQNAALIVAHCEAFFGSVKLYSDPNETITIDTQEGMRKIYTYFEQAGIHLSRAPREKRKQMDGLMLVLAELRNLLVLVIKGENKREHRKFPNCVEHVKFLLHGRDVNAISQERSTKMGGAAELSKDVLGVWKVGNDHIGDIHSQPGSRGFETLTRDEFYNEYDITGINPTAK